MKTGDRYGKWVVLEYKNSMHVNCRCDCGSTKTLTAGNLRRVSSAGNNGGCNKCQFKGEYGQARMLSLRSNRLGVSTKGSEMSLRHMGKILSVSHTTVARSISSRGIDNVMNLIEKSYK